MDRLRLFIASCALLVSPIYIWESGLPQVAHFLMLPAIITLGWARAQQWPDAFRYAIAFALYAACVNVVVYTIFRDLRTLYAAFYYPFNVLSWLVFASLARGAWHGPFLKWLPILLWLCLGTQAFIVGTGFFSKEEASRPTGTFNDPNQLAHWTLWMGTLLCINSVYLRRSIWNGCAAACVVGYVVLLCGSRSGLLGFIVLLLGLAMVLMKPHEEKRVVSFIYSRLLLLTCASVAILLLKDDLKRLMSEHEWNALDRLLLTEWAFELEARGYDRLIKFPEHLLLGAGEGAEERWMMHSWFLGEIHSTPAGLLFSYGLPGTVLFGMFWVTHWRQVPGAGLKLVALAPWAYSIGTYNLRNWMVWVGLALLHVMLSSRPNGTQRSQQIAPAATRPCSSKLRTWPTRKAYPTGVNLRRSSGQ
ncbi:MAG: hypothetical protein RMN51_03085 [Verrucomicrobiota bacterium]|nr:hypothetical protein [Limisphaera sp.]MDW8381083.1 hypothetical protein [Verrucomicrobiota bacterium]